MYKSRFFMQLSVFVFSLFLLSACGSNNSEGSLKKADPIPDGNATLSIAQLSISGGDVTVSQNNEAVSIRVKALTEDDTLATEGTILAQYLEANSSNSGELTPSKVTLSEGFATFVYVAPKDLQKQIDSGNNGTSFKFYSEDDTTITTTVNVIFDTTVDTTSSDPISKLILSESTITVSKSQESKTITVRGLKIDNTAVVNGKVTIQYPSTDSVDAGSVPAEVSIVDGVGSFTYVSPTDIINAASISPAQFKLYDKTNPSVFTFFNVNFSGGTNIIPRLTVTPTPVTVTQNSESVSVTVLATDANGTALQSGTIQVLNTVGASAGLFGESEIDIVNGRATFSYTGPNPLSNGSATFTFKLKDTNYSTPWRVIFTPEAGVAVPTIKKLVVNKDIEVGTDGQTETVQVFAFTNAAGTIPATSGTVGVRYPAPVDGVDVGVMSPAEAEIDANGIATFTFTAPTPLVTLPNPKTFSFTSNGQSADVDITYSRKVDPVTDGPDAIHVLKEDINITKNSEVVTIRVRVFRGNNPYDGGNVNVTYPNEASAGSDVGSMTPLSVPCVNGIADFIYKAPSDLSSLDYSNALVFTFKHDHEGSTGSAQVNITMVPDPGQIVITTYELNMVASDGNNTMGLESIKAFTAKVTDEDGNEINEGNYTITNLNPQIADILDTDGTKSDFLQKDNEKNVIFRMETYKKSGLIPVKIKVDFVDVNGNSQSIERVFNIVVFSGPPTAISISYASTSHTAEDKANAKFVEHMVVTVTDKYSNLVNTRPAISVGAIVGYVGGTNPVNYLYREPDSSETGLIDPQNNAFMTNTGRNFNAAYPDGVDYDNDILVTFGKDYTYNASGKWDFEPGSNTQLHLLDNIEGSAAISNLGFAIGNNKRNKTCSPGSEAVSFTQVEEGAYQLSENGIAKISMDYDYYLVGKEVLFWINIVGYQADQANMTKVGEAHKHTLRGNGLTPIPAAISVKAGTTKIVNVRYQITDTVEWYRNAYAGPKIEGDCGYSVRITDPGSCSFITPNTTISDTDGLTYWEITATAGAEDCSLSITDALVGGEGL